ncbi:LysR family transcriptional regulator [Pseudomonas huanghezhanensis]|uniref:LysR family transcriptional regulator n=1 Tax=Pseudomonas huanghezhanensis TaxID=3002903 RepID=UPI0022863D2E|nr:LysR family transcriptional regulator [Pseudomonas sp. BSw22131]
MDTCLPLALLSEEQRQYFLLTARCGCFRQAARRLNIRPVALRRALQQLEQTLGHTLFENGRNPLVLSPAARLLQAQWLGPLGLPRLALAEDGQPPLRLAIAEPLLHDLLSRPLVDFLRKNGGLRVQVQALPTELREPLAPADLLLWLGTDAAVRGASAFTPPVRLTTLRYLPHVAQRYVRELARPASVPELQAFMLVQWVEHQDIAALSPWNEVVAARSGAVTQVHSHVLNCIVIRSGAGIGVLPDYARTLDRNFVPLPHLFTEPMQRPVWLALACEKADDPHLQAIAELFKNACRERNKP